MLHQLDINYVYFINEYIIRWNLNDDFYFILIVNVNVGYNDDIGLLLYFNK